MDPVTTTVFVVIAATAAAAYFWTYILEFIQMKVLPFVRTTLGDSVAERLVDLTVFLDQKICITRHAVAKAWNAFRHHVLGSRTIFSKVDAHTAEATTETFVRDESSRVMKKVEVEEVPWAEIPEDIRSQMMRARKDQAVMDNVKVVKEGINRRCEEVGYEMVA